MVETASDESERGIAALLLGAALWTLGQRESGTARLEEAVATYRAALTEHTQERVPLQWAMTQNNLGLALSTLILIVLSSTASHEFRWKEAVLVGIGLAVLAVGVFIIGLKLTLPIWPVFS